MTRTEVANERVRLLIGAALMRGIGPTGLRERASDYAEVSAATISRIHAGKRKGGMDTLDAIVVAVGRVFGVDANIQTVLDDEEFARLRDRILEQTFYAVPSIRNEPVKVPVA